MQIVIFVPKYEGEPFMLGLRDESRNHMAWFVNQIKQEAVEHVFYADIKQLTYIDFIYRYGMGEYRKAEDYLTNLAIRLSETLVCDVNIITKW